MKTQTSKRERALDSLFKPHNRLLIFMAFKCPNDTVVEASLRNSVNKENEIETRGSYKHDLSLIGKLWV